MIAFVRRIFLPALLLISSFVMANRVVVKGWVRYPNGVAAVGYPVFVRADTAANTSCLASKQVVTGTLGGYEAVLECNTTIRKVWVHAGTCDGKALLLMMEVPATGVVEANFTLCTPTGCKPEFAPIFNNTSPLSVQFTSQASVAGEKDEIVSRRWSWGDGTPVLEGNIISPVHVFAAAGQYEVCLTTKTRNGCEKKVCKVIRVEAQAPACKPEFRWEFTNTQHEWFFTSAPTTIAAGDSIIRRVWSFGDGTPLVDGNLVSVKHKFPGPGTYEVCLKIVTKKGCEQKLCKPFVVEGSPACKPEYKWEKTNTLHEWFFTSTPTTIAPGDSIVRRIWSFGDNTPVTDGNPLSVKHKFPGPGTYNVCLKIVTLKGCEQVVCKPFVVEGITTSGCKPDFRWEPTTTSSQEWFFTSAPTTVAVGDTIVRRVWTFGDGTPAVDGNLATVKHRFPATGSYEVCLKIVTKKGCEQKICKLVFVGQQNTACNASFRFSQESPNKIRFNSSTAGVTLQGDSIVRRIWDFGDGIKLTGNIVSPLHEYKWAGSYQVCLVVVTARGCESRTCQWVRVEGTNDRVDSAMVKIMSTYPNPAKENLYTVLWAKQAYTKATITVLDVYGQVKWTVSVMLPQGNSTWNIPTGRLLPGPYVLQVVTAYGVMKQSFLRMN